MSNEVTLELTGNADSLEEAIQNATRQVQNMDGAVDTASTHVQSHASKIDRSFADMSDRMATKAGTLAGGIGAITGGMALLGIGQDSLAGQIVGGLAVTVGTLSGVMDILAIATESQTIAMVGQKIAMVAQAGATGVVTAAQWLWNAAMSANPIGLIIVAIGVLIGAIVLIATKTTWFQDLWKTVWGGIKDAAGAVADFFVHTVWEGGIKKAFDFIGDGVGKVKDWFTGIPGKIKDAFSGLVDIIKWPYVTAFNFISDAWNGTIGKLSWTVPSWVPFVGGHTVSAPKLPHFDEGGIMPGALGQAGLAVLHGGERVLTIEQQRAMGGLTINGGVTIMVDPTKFKRLDDMLEWVDNLRNDGRRGAVITA